MNRRAFQFAVVLLWLALPLVALEYRQAWDHLPAQMAVHFNAANQANGWMAREESRDFSLRMIAIALTVSTLVLAAVSWHKVEAFTWALLAFFALAIGFLVSVNHAILNYNLNATPVHPERMLVLLMLAVVALIVIYVASHRHPPLPAGETLAVETHASPLWSLIILIALLGPALAVALVPTPPARLALGLVGVIGLGAFAMAWSGFQYRFLHHGLEIRMLGFRLRSIPRSAIVSYAIEPWPFIRGYGIRGMGSTRAYVWCNQVVHIRMSNGDVYLGHNDPERVVRDLDRMMGFVTRG
jgi:Protein of unknown function (DUF1648)